MAGARFRPDRVIDRLQRLAAADGAGGPAVRHLDRAAGSPQASLREPLRSSLHLRSERYEERWRSASHVVLLRSSRSRIRFRASCRKSRPRTSRPSCRASRRRSRRRGPGPRARPTTRIRSSAGGVGSSSRAGSASASARPSTAPSGFRGARRSPSASDETTGSAAGGGRPLHRCTMRRSPTVSADSTPQPRSRRRRASSGAATRCARRSAPSSAGSRCGAGSSSASVAGAQRALTRRSSTSRSADTVACPSSPRPLSTLRGWRSRCAHTACRSSSSPVRR
jgi:hypothetical protein